MRNRSKWVAALLVAAFAAAPLDASAQKAGETHRFPESWRANFMSGCTEGGGADDAVEPGGVSGGGQCVERGLPPQ